MPAYAYLLFIFALIATSCTNTKYHPDSRLFNSTMNLSEGRSETNIYQKTYYSREGSVGGIGSIAGGGCGCY